MTRKETGTTQLFLPEYSRLLLFIDYLLQTI